MQLDIYVYQLHVCDTVMEELDEDENVPAGNNCILPSAHFSGLWESLVYDEDIKQNVFIAFRFRCKVCSFSGCSSLPIGKPVVFSKFVSEL